MTTTILALDTAMAACSAAVWRDGILSHRFERMERGHAERIAPMVDEVMREASITFAELDRVAVTTGPGTFTGQRIGLAMARGLGLGLDKPVIGITTLETIAAAQANQSRPIVVACDARREECYFASFAADLSSLHDTALLAVDIAARNLPSESVFVLGSAADAVIAASGRDDLMRIRHDLPDARHLAALAAKRAVTRDPPEPLYLRSPDAKPQPGMTQIRRGEAGDAATIAALHAACFENAWDEAAIRGLLATPGTRAWLAQTCGVATGFALTRQVVEEIEILSLGTHPSARRGGIARRLAEAIEKTAVSTLFLDVAAGNEAARALYRSCGFSETGRRARYYARKNGAREDAILMSKGVPA